MIPPRVCEGIIDQLSALNQAESRSRSENIEFGIRHRMRSGKTLLNHTRLLGYTKGPDGGVQIVSEEAEIVRMIFDLYVQGSGVWYQSPKRRRTSRSAASRYGRE